MQYRIVPKGQVMQAAKALNICLIVASTWWMLHTGVAINCKESRYLLPQLADDFVQKYGKAQHLAVFLDQHLAVFLDPHLLQSFMCVHNVRSALSKCVFTWCMMSSLLSTVWSQALELLSG